MRFAAVHESGSGPSRHFAATQWLVRFRGTAEARERMISGQDGANDPKATLAKSEAASALVHRTLLGATALAKINDWLSLCFAYSDTGKIGAEMISDPGAREEEICPVSDDLLGALYRSDKQGIAELVATVAPNVRVLLALFCYPRSHLNTMGLAIAATCEEDDLVRRGGRVGAVLYARSREAPQLGSVPSHAAERRRITLATGPLRKMIPLDDELDEASPSGAAEETKVVVAVLDDFNNAANSTGGAADTALAASEAVEAAAVNLRQRIKNLFIGRVSIEATKLPKSSHP